jgi:hypothetical protein
MGKAGVGDDDAKPALLQSGDTLAARSPALETIMTMSPFAVTAYINQLVLNRSDQPSKLLIVPEPQPCQLYVECGMYRHFHQACSSSHEGEVLQRCLYHYPS